MIGSLIKRRYRLEAILGEGSVGTTYRALDEATANHAALKVLRDNPDSVLGIEREFGLLSGLSHPALAEVRDFGFIHQAGGGPRPFFTSRLIEGRSLAEVDLTGDQLRSVAIDVLGALHYLHRAGVRHGDVSPNNILVQLVTGRASAVLIDLSAAGRLTDKVRATSGTPGFIAPEVLPGNRVDERADLYSLGRALKNAFGRVSDPSADGAGEDIYLKMCVTDRKQRPASAAQVLRLLGADAELSGAPDATHFPELLGREDALSSFELFLQKTAPRTFWIAGVDESGRSRLLEECKWRVQRRFDTAEAVGLRPVRGMLSRITGLPAQRPAQVLLAVDALSELGPMVLFVDDAHRLSEEDSLALEAVLDSENLGTDLRVVVASRRLPNSDLDRTVVEIGSLSPEEVERWAAHAGIGIPTQRLLETTENLPGRLARALAQLQAGTDIDLSRTDSAGQGETVHSIPARTVLAQLREGEKELARKGFLALSDLADEDVSSQRRFAIEVATALPDPDVRVRAANMLLDAGDPRHSTNLLKEPFTDGTSEQQTLRALALAEAELRRTQPREALRYIEDGLAFTSDATSSQLRDLQARAHIALGQYEDADRISAAALALPGASATTTARLHENRGLSLGYLDDWDSAGPELLRALELHAQSSDDRKNARGLLRCRSYQGILAFRRGDLSAATTSYTQALEIAEQHGFDDQLATLNLNLGTAQQLHGAFGKALDSYQTSLRYARVLGRSGTQATLEFNVANLYFELGLFEAAEERLDRARKVSAQHEVSHLNGPIHRLEGELALQASDWPRAQGALMEAKRIASNGSGDDLCEVELLLAELRSEEGHRDEALKDAASILDRTQSPSLLARANLFRGRLLLSLGREVESKPLLEQALALSESDGAGFVAIEARCALAHLCQQQDLTELADDFRRAAVRDLERIEFDLAPALRDTFRAHPRRQPPGLARGGKPQASVGTLSRSRLRRFLAINQALNSSLDQEQVLAAAIDAAVELTAAERGFVLLAFESEGTTEFRVAASKNLSVSSSQEEELQFSRSIAEEVVRSREPVITVDARQDARFHSGRSVHAMKLKSVLCVPVQRGDRVLGALYLDNRFERARFEEGDVEILEAFAGQVAIAMVNAELHDALKQRTKDLLAAQVQLRARVKGQAQEISDLSEQVRDRQAALEYRYDYSQIVGRSEPIRALLATLERVIDSDLSILVDGESGTGKELVAKAIHFNGARKDARMVSLNCAALNETLIESELFGYEKGSFTGAETKRVGLLASAQGGTVFLDEVGEMPLGVQAKLLRALQEREVWPIGANEPLSIDIRLVCATNRDLREEIEAGRFREDLFYRIGVVQLSLPPLRERRPDITDLIIHFLSAHEGVRLTDEARRALTGYDWPGNVRQLSNVIARAVVMADDDMIQLEDLDLPAGSHSERVFAADEPESERLRRALRARRWNVSRVSRDLDIPRQTLYRKIKKYGLQRPK